MIILLIILTTIAFYFYATKSHKYWAERNVKHNPPIPLFGNHLPNQLGQKSVTTIFWELYKKYSNEKVVGYYRGRVPELMIRDPDIIKCVLSADFDHFYYRGFARKSEPLFANLFHADGDVWRLLRQRITPAFTTAKLKGMFPLVVKCAEKLQELVGEMIERGDECDARELMARFTTEFIGACGFGIEMDAINNQRSQFRELGILIFARPLKIRLLFPLLELFPELKSVLYVSDHSVEDGITAIVNKIREQRNYKPSGRNDFIDLLLELETKGKIVGESIEKRAADGTPVQAEIDMDVKLIVAQVFIFFAAGFETSSSATSFTLHQLAFYPEIQTKIQKEIDEVLSRHNNKLCYEAVAEMSYLDMTFKEAMRMFPSLGVLNRVCTKKYTIPGTNLTIDPGVKIAIPIQALQMDEKYFDNPKEFRPERFLPKAVQGRHKYVYLPFGEGPRACVGKYKIIASNLF